MNKFFKNKCFSIAFPVGMKLEMIFSDFQVLTSEGWWHINFFTSLGQLACLKLCVLKHGFELMLYVVPTTPPHRQQA